MVDSRVEFAEIGGIRLAKVKASKAGVSVVLQPSDLTHECVDVVFQRRGNSAITQRGRTVHLSEGQWVVLQAEQLSVVSNVADTAEQIVLLIPRDRLAADLDIGRVALRALSGDSGVGQLLGHAVQCFGIDLPKIAAQRADSIAQILYALIGLALYERLAVELPHLTKRSKERREIQQYIDEHLSDPQLSLKRIARYLGRSERHLHNVFRESGSTIGRYVLQQRLNRVREDLKNPNLSHLSVTDIAVSRGFNSVNYFARAFRAHFGVSPNQERKQARQAQCAAVIEPTSNTD